ncbi:MAG: DUF4838 domain-containing protein [Armatimonadota bacterium]
MRTWIAAVLVIAVSLSSAMAADFPVVDGDRQATIVYSIEAATAEAEEWPHAIQPRQPATELVEYIEKVTGRRLDMVCEDALELDSETYPLYVGDCSATRENFGDELNELDRDAYMIIVEPERAFLAGSRRVSTYWAVCQFLRDYLDVRWLIPGPLGEDIAEHERITISPGEATETPTLLSRQWSGMGYVPGALEWSLRHRVHVASWYERYSFHHNLPDIFDPDIYYDEHPEYFPVHDGERFRPESGAHNWQPCMTETGTVEVAAQAAREHFNDNPDDESFSFGTADGAGWCHCPECLRLRDDDRQCGRYPSPYSRLYYSWLTEVGAELDKTHPDKLLGCLAYTNSVCPPTELDVDEDILPYITFAIADTYAPSTWRAAQKIIADWGDLVDQIGFYDYAYGNRFILPRIYSHQIQEVLQYGLKHNLKGVYAEVYPHFGLDAPRLYATTALWWNPNVNLNALMDDWYQRMFREAAEPMQKYFERCEQALRENPRYRNCQDGFFVFARDVLFDAYPPEVVTECTAHLDEAERRASSEIVKKRINFFRKTWDLGAIFARAYWGDPEIRNLIESGAPLEKIAAAMSDISPPRTPEEWWEEIDNRVGDDRLAYFPIKRLLSGKTLPAHVNAEVRLLSQHLAAKTLGEAGRRKMLNAPAARRAIEREVDGVFDREGSEGYELSVQHLRQMAGRVAGAPKIMTPPEIDGVLDDDAWSATYGARDFTARGSMEPAEYSTIFHLAHDAQNLYIAVECFQETSEIAPEATLRDGDVWRDNGVEIFIRSAKHPETWAHFALNAAGGLYDRWDDGSGSDLSYDFNCDWAAEIHPDRWTAELRVPLAEMQIDPDESRLLRINVVRNVVTKPREIGTWYPEPWGGAHADTANQGWAILE